MVSAAAAAKSTDVPSPKHKAFDWILDGLKGIFVLILVATIGPKLFPDVFDKLNWSTSQSTVSLSIFVPGGYTVRANPPGVTCGPVSATNCTLKYRPGTRVTLTAQRGEFVTYQGALSWTGCVGSGDSCTLVPSGRARVCLVEPGYPGMPWDWCRG